MIELCPDCRMPVYAHFRTDGERAGEPRGCPFVVAGLVAQAAYPRVVIRIGKVEQWKGRTLIAWADSRDSDGRVLVWDMDADTYDSVCPLRLREGTRAPNTDQRAAIVERLAFELGEPVRVVKTISGGQGSVARRTAQAGAGAVPLEE